MRKIAHIINPVMVGKNSDLFFAQPITFETMKIARQFAHGRVEVELLSTQYPEDLAIVPEGFKIARELERSVQDVGRFELKRKLPLLRDILDRLYEATAAEYLIYTNVDIALMPHFYVTVNALIDAGHDAFVINRRTISNQYQSPAEIPLMYAETGAKHEGHACFVFKRDHYPRYTLGEVCIGIPYVGRALIWNLFFYAKNFCELKKSHLTFHVGFGNERTLQDGVYADYRAHNKGEAAKVKAKIASEFAPGKNCEVFSIYPLEFELVSPTSKSKNQS